jgi:hypothetical protein
MQWTVVRAPSSPPIDFYSTIDLLSTFELRTRHVIIHSEAVVMSLKAAVRTVLSQRETQY